MSTIGSKLKELLSYEDIAKKHGDIELAARYNRLVGFIIASIFYKIDYEDMECTIQQEIDSVIAQLEDMSFYLKTRDNK